MRDRGFTRLIASTTLRRLGQIDCVIRICLNRPLPDSANTVQDILRLAGAEILFLDIAPYATVNSAVAQARARQLDRFAGLINAVLRRMSREGKAILDGIPVTRNIPEWMMRGWETALGRDIAERIAAAIMRDPPLDISVKSDTAAWANRLKANVLKTGSLRCDFDGPINEMPGFAEGSWWVQDAAAALPATLMGQVRGKQILDMCAAPGGKTAQLLAAGAQVTAVDRAKQRMARLHQNLARLGMCAQTKIADATVWHPETRFDAVLVDSPCTATGTIRRHPDILHMKSRGDLSKLIMLQDRLLNNAIRVVKPGGRIVFCTCSLQPEEGEQRIEALLASGAPVRRDPIYPKEIGGIPDVITAAGDLRTLPIHLHGQGGLDGFFAVRLIRT